MEGQKCNSESAFSEGFDDVKVFNLNLFIEIFVLFLGDFLACGYFIRMLRWWRFRWTLRLDFEASFLFPVIRRRYGIGAIECLEIGFSNFGGIVLKWSFLKEALFRFLIYGVFCIRAGWIGLENIFGRTVFEFEVFLSDFLYLLFHSDRMGLLIIVGLGDMSVRLNLPFVIVIVSQFFILADGFESLCDLMLAFRESFWCGFRNKYLWRFL